MVWNNHAALLRPSFPFHAMLAFLTLRIFSLVSEFFSSHNLEKILVRPAAIISKEGPKLGLIHK